MKAVLGRVGEKTSCVYWRGSGNPLLVLEFVSLSFLLRKGRKFFSQVPGCPWCLWEGFRGLAYVATLGIIRTVQLFLGQVSGTQWVFGSPE